jgi:hypothetical protein
MVPAHLTAVPSVTGPAAGEVYDLNRGVETPAQRIRRLQQEARILARQQVEDLAREFNALAQRAAEIVEGGEAYPAGVRELAGRLAADLPAKAQLIMSIMDRTG